MSFWEMAVARALRESIWSAPAVSGARATVRRVEATRVERSSAEIRRRRCTLR
jgi:hypothetical protein